ncbi:MAG: riboflavin synthase [Phycisphaerales bacterium JB059]
MYTGLVQAMGHVVGAEDAGGSLRLEVDPGEWRPRFEAGESISINGCCLTLVEAPGEGEPLRFDAIPETLRRTTLGALGVGSRVNLERSATPTTLLGGHIVQGHVDGVGRVSSVQREGEYRVRIEAPEGLMEFVTPKGSVCVQGVSLTVAALSPGEAWFEVALIPTTLALTTLGELGEGDRVNLECDIIAKTILHHARHYSGADR